MFEAFCDLQAVQKVLLSRAEFKPYPRWGEANLLTEDQKQALIAEGEKYLDYNWPVATAMQYAQFAIMGSRQPYEIPNAARRRALAALADAEYAEQKGRFIEDIINGVWATMDEATWVVPAHNDGHELPNPDRPAIICLFSAGTAGMLANIYYLFKEQIDAVSPLVLRRLEKVMEERMLAPFLNNLYWWSGATGASACNWTPWIVSNALLCFGLMCKDEARRAAAVARGVWMVDHFVDVYTEDGGCEEGPSYWFAAGGALFDCLCLLSDLTGGAFDSFFKVPKVQNIGRYICRAHIAGPYFTNYADAAKTFFPSADMIYRYGKKIEDKDMTALGVAVRDLCKNGAFAARVVNMHSDYRHHYRHMLSVLAKPELEAQENHGFPLLESVFIDGIEMMAERQKYGEEKGMYLSAKGGHNNESHNHNDIGSCILYSDGQPVLIDLGAGLYSAKTFSPQRYEIPQMQSSYHNLPEINGVMQMNGVQYRSRNVSYSNENGVSVFSLDIAAAYPAAAGVNSWQRTYTFNRLTETVTIVDEAAFAGEKNHCDTMFIVPVEPEICGNAVTVTVEGARPVALTGEGVTFTAEEVDLTFDVNLTNHWNGKVWRIKAAADCSSTHKQIFTIKQK